MLKTMTDPIADMLTRMRNALAAGKAEVLLPYSKFKKNLADLLKQHGLIEEVFIMEKRDKKKFLGLKLKYANGRPIITELKRISKPGQRIYAKAESIPRAQNGFGITVVSTSKGLLSDKDARKQRLGGEIICQIW